MCRWGKETFLFPFFIFFFVRKHQTPQYARECGPRVH
jgi:hypothetical protein